MKGLSVFQTILIAVFGIGALVGLFVFATYSSTGTSSQGIGTVTIWGTLPKDQIDAMLTTALQTDNNLKSVVYEEKDAATLPSELASAIATGAPPDLVLASQEQLLSLTRYLQPIPPATLSASTFTSAFINEGQLFGAGAAGFYGVPFLVDPLVLYSNRTILSSVGVTRPPQTWEAVTGLVSTVATLTPNRQITRALIGLGGYDNIVDARGILSALFLQTNVPLTTSSATGGFSANLGTSAEKGVAPGHAVLAFYTQFADPSKVSYTWNAALPTSQAAFISGDAALYLGYVSEAEFIRAANPNLNFDVSPLPQPGTASAKKTYGLVYALMIPRGAQNSPGAFQAAALLTNDLEQQLSAANTGLAPASLTALSTHPNDPIAEVGYASALYAVGWLSPDPRSVDRIFSAMITNVISGRTDIDSALTSAESTLGSLLQ